MSAVCAALFVDFISLLLPFFDIGFIQKGFVYSFTAFAFPAAAYLWVYRTSAARASSPKKPGWVPAASSLLCLPESADWHATGTMQVDPALLHDKYTQAQDEESGPHAMQIGTR